MTENPDARSELLRGIRERRSISDFELRAGPNGTLHFTGHAALFDVEYTVYDFLGSFTEVVDRKALNRTMSRQPDVVLNVNHNGLPLARTTSGTLRLSLDESGLYVDADLEPRDPDVNSVRYKLERGDMADMSWAFRVLNDQWSIVDGEDHRRIMEANIDGGDVSIVTTGANPATDAQIGARSAVSYLSQPDALVEVRSLDDPDAIAAAIKTLEGARGAAKNKTLSVAAAERALLLD